MRPSKISIRSHLLFLIFILVSCTSKKDPQTLTSFTFSDLFNKCTSNAHYRLKPIIDTSNHVKISLPENWEIQIVNDSVARGVFAMDTSLFLDKNLVHTILTNTVNADGPLDNYFKSELQG